MKYLIGIRVRAESGDTHEDNMDVKITILTARELYDVKALYCESLRARGVQCSADKAVIFAVIPLQG